MSNDFITNYLTYCEGNEVPKSFHRWAAIGALSCLVSRRIWIDFGIYEDHCNMYILLVGSPASKKSTAMGIARKLVQACGIQIAPASVTKQRIWELMDSKNKKSGCNTTFEYDGLDFQVSQFPMFCNEIVTMLAAGGDALGMIEFLTDVWDRPFYDTDTKNAGTNIIHGPYITILGCMTPDQTGSLLKQDIITGGFSRRCIMVTPDTSPAPVPFPIITPEQKEAWNNCVRIGKELLQVKGQFLFDDEARALWAQWYSTVFAKQQSNLPAAVTYFLGSLPRYATQLSMLMELSSDRSSRTIHAATLKRAIAWLEPLQDNLADIFAGAGKNPLANVSAKIMAYLRKNGPTPLKQLRQVVWDHADTNQFDVCVKHLTSVGKVREAPITIAGQLQIQLVLTGESHKPQPFEDVRMSPPTPEIDLGPLSAIDLSDPSVEDET